MIITIKHIDLLYQILIIHVKQIGYGLKRFIALVYAINVL